MLTSGRWGFALVLLVLGLSFSLAPTAAYADTLSWSVTATGTIAYAGFGTSGNPLSGSNIGIASVSHNGTTLNIVNGLLSFVTGGAGADLGSWSWGGTPSGVLTLSGCISGVTVSGGCTSSDHTTLLGDDFTSATIFQAGGGYQVQLGQINGTLGAALAQYFGVSTVVSSALYDSTINVNGAAVGQAFNGFNLGGSINTTSSAAPANVPEPSSAGLLGFGLVGLAVAMSTRRKLLV
jgi:hypothetical protein